MVWTSDKFLEIHNPDPRKQTITHTSSLAITVGTADNHRKQVGTARFGAVGREVGTERFAAVGRQRPAHTAAADVRNRTVVAVVAELFERRRQGRNHRPQQAREVRPAAARTAVATAVVRMVAVARRGHNLRRHRTVAAVGNIPRSVSAVVGN